MWYFLNHLMNLNKKKIKNYLKKKKKFENTI